MDRLRYGLRPSLRRAHADPTSWGELMAISGETTWPPVGRTDGRFAMASEAPFEGMGTTATDRSSKATRRCCSARGLCGRASASRAHGLDRPGVRDRVSVSSSQSHSISSAGSWAIAVVTPCPPVRHASQRGQAQQAQLAHERHIGAIEPELTGLAKEDGPFDVHVMGETLVAAGDADEHQGSRPADRTDVAPPHPRPTARNRCVSSELEFMRPTGH